MSWDRPPPEDVVRSVFDHGSTNRLSEGQLAAVLDDVTNVLTKGSNPVQELCISSSSFSPAPFSQAPPTFFWFMISKEGHIEHVNEHCQSMIGYKTSDLLSNSIFTLVSPRDHHIVPPILHAGPSTSMSCRLHINTNKGSEIPFDVTFAKLSTRQLNTECTAERSATLCVARSVLSNHGSLSILLDSNNKIIEYENSCELSLLDSDLLSHSIYELCSKADQNVLETLIQSQSDCSAELFLRLGSSDVISTVRAVHSKDTVRLHCSITRLLPCSKTSCFSPESLENSSQSAIVSNGDPLSQLCSTLFTEEFMDTAECVASSSAFPHLPIASSEIKDEKPKKPRKPRIKKPKQPAQPVKDATLKKLLTTTTRTTFEPMVESGVHGQIIEHPMYQASTMSAQPMYMNNNMNGMAYQGNQCSSYMQPGMCPTDFPMGPQGGQMVPQQWPHDYYHQQQVPMVPTSQPKSLKRKVSTTPDRPNKMPYGHNPAFAFQQAGPMMESAIPQPQDEFHLQPINSHLSPYRYSPGSSPYWPANGRPPSRTEMVRMELRNSIQAKQMANQHRHPHPLADHGSADLQSSASMGADSLGFDLDIVLKDADGSLMDSELDTVYDFNLAGGCGFQFDMENDATRCLVMKLLS